MKAATYLPSQTGQSHKMRTFNSYCLNFKKDLNKHFSVPRLKRLSKETFLFMTSIDVAYEMCALKMFSKYNDVRYKCKLIH